MFRKLKVWKPERHLLKRVQQPRLSLNDWQSRHLCRRFELLCYTRVLRNWCSWKTLSVCFLQKGWQNGFSEKRRVATEEVRFQCKNGFSESLSFCSKVVSCVSFYRMIILVVDFFSRACGADVSFYRMIILVGTDCTFKNGHSVFIGPKLDFIWFFAKTGCA